MFKIQVMGAARVWMDLTDKFGDVIVFKNRESASSGIEHEKEMDRKPPKNNLQYRIMESTPETGIVILE